MVPNTFNKPWKIDYPHHWLPYKWIDRRDPSGYGIIKIESHFDLYLRSGGLLENKKAFERAFKFLFIVLKEHIVEKGIKAHIPFFGDIYVHEKKEIERGNYLPLKNKRKYAMVYDAIPYSKMPMSLYRAFVPVDGWSSVHNGVFLGRGGKSYGSALALKAIRAKKKKGDVYFKEIK